MAEHRRYTKRQKVVAISAAMASSTLAASEQLRVPRKTIAYWLDHPQFAELRQKTRENLAEEMHVLAHLLTTKLSEKADSLEPRDLVVALGIVTDKAQLLSGAATHRIETKDLDVFDDHETRAIVAGARKYLEGAGPAEGPAVVEAAVVEGAGA